MKLPAPEITGADFRLRSWTVADAPALVAAWADPTIVKFNAVPPEPTLETAQRWIRGEQVRLDRNLSIDLVIDCGGAVHGEVGLSGFSASRAGALIGYWLLPDSRGKGRASAAVRALSEWAHVALELDVIVARCDPTNVASQRVAERAGFHHEENDPMQQQLWRSRTRS